jgi:hypothetical protein
VPRYSEWDKYEPPAIRRALPLEWAVGQLFDAWGAGAAMMPCPLPYHQDDTASFNLWAEDADGFPIRYGCFGCGSNGDVVDLIRIKRGVGFLEACRIAVEELIPEMERSDWRPADRTVVERSRAATPAELEAALTRLRASDAPSIQPFLERKGMADLGAGFANYLRQEWRWGAFLTPAPTIFFPHRDWDYQLTGIRFRSARRDGTRWTETGSRFPALYGAWRDRGRPKVLLCEGETDTVWGAWQVEGPLSPWDVMGLPAGAAQKPPEDAVRRLAGRDVYTAFDGDMAGRIATARWHEALDGAFAVPIPDGEDVLSCGISITDLIAEAE